MAREHHSHRRQRKSGNAARLGIAGGVTGVVGVAAVAGLVLVVRSHGGEAASAPGVMADRTSAGTARTGGRTLAQLKTGQKLDVNTPDGYSYSLAAVGSGTSDRPLASTRTPPPQGATLAYVDYVITNAGSDEALLDFPADLFVKRALVPASAAARCMPQPGAPADMCTLPDHTDVVNTLGFAAPRSEDGDQYIPPGASYLVRVATDLPVTPGTKQSDLGLYVFNSRFVADRQAVDVPFPGAG
jgi:hypothetical protein